MKYIIKKVEGLQEWYLHDNDVGERVTPMFKTKEEAENLKKVLTMSRVD